MLRKLFPINSRRRQLAKNAYYLVNERPADGYAKWRFEQTNQIPLHTEKDITDKPLISIVIPVYNTPQRYLLDVVYSVIGQYYNNWELVLVDASDDENASNRVAQISEHDERIVVVKAKNKGISENTNVGVRAANGVFVGFMDHDDVLHEMALQEIVKHYIKKPKARLFYSDEDKMSDDGKKVLNPFFKPGWSPALLKHVNYITHFTVAEKKLVEEVGYLSREKDGAQDYDLLLRMTDKLEPSEIVHIPKVLYHWREAQNSTAQHFEHKPYVKNAGVQSLKEHFARRGVKAEVEALATKPGFYTVRYQTKQKPTVIVMPFATENLVTEYVKMLVSKGFVDGKSLIVPHPTGSKGELVLKETKTNFLPKALQKVKTEGFVLVDDLVLPQTKTWADELVGVLQEKNVRAVSPLIITDENGRIQVDDSGIVHTGEGIEPLFKGFEYDINTFFGDTSWPRNVDRLSGRVVAMRTKDTKKLPINKQRPTRLADKLGPDEFFYVWSNVVMSHVKVPLVRASSPHLFNSNLRTQQDQFGLYANEQQLVDAVEKFRGSDE